MPVPTTRTARLLVTCALLAAWGIFFAPALFSDGIPFDRDLIQGSIPWRQFAMEAVLRGTLPTWYPHEMLGTPFVGAVVTATFHPQTWLLLPLTPVMAIKVNVLGAFLIMEWGAYRAARVIGASRPGAVTSAWALAFGGYAVGISNNLPYLVPLATMPWVLFAAWRLSSRARPRDAAFLAVAWALVFLGGDALGFAECGALVGVALFAQRLTGRTLLLSFTAALGATALASIEGLPAFYVSRESFRSVWRNADWLATRWALHPLRLPELVISNFIPYDWRLWLGENLLTGRAGVWSASIFVGGVALWLAGLGVLRRQRGTWLLLTVVVVSVWLALGSYGGLLTLGERVLPGLGWFRYPEKYLGLAWVAGVPLVGLGFDAMRGRVALWWGAAWLVLAALAWRLPVVAWYLHLKPVELPPKDPAYLSIQHSWVAGLALTGVALVVAGAVVDWLPRQARWAVSALVFVELLVGNRSHLRLASRAAVEYGVPWADGIRGAAPDAPSPRAIPYDGRTAFQRITSENDQATFVHTSLQQDDAGRAGVDSWAEELPSESERATNLLGGKTGVDPAVYRSWFNICFRVVDITARLAPGEKIFAVAPWFHIALVHMPCRDRAYLSGAVAAANETAARQRLRTGLPDGTVVWEGGPVIPPATGSVRWLSEAPDDIEVESTADRPAALVVSDAWSAGWTATLDGEPVPLWATNTAVRGVAVPAGTHRVRMLYDAPGLRAGKILCALGWVLVLILFLLGGKAQPRHASAAFS